MNENILDLRGISKSFGAVKANQNVDMQVRKGSVHAIVGENGAGKSTLMNIIAGIHKPDDGQIVLNGEVVSFKDPTDASNHGIGMVHQEFMLCSDLSVLDNIMLGFEKKKGPFIDKKAVEKRVLDICQEYHFDIPLKEPVKDLPVAILQQVEIVKVLYRGAEVIILDEPTSVLTPQGIEGLFEAIRFLVKSGKTILFITHKLKEVMEISDSITVMKDGRVTGHVRPQDVDEKKLASMMVGRDVMLVAQPCDKTIGEPLLEVNDLCVTDREARERVHGVSLAIKSGEILGIAGIAGSGQRELVEALFGLSTPVGGSVKFNGEDITKATCRQRRCMGIGYVPQNRMELGANGQSSVWENAIMGYHIVHGFESKLLLDKEQANEFASQVVRDFSVKAENNETKVRTLSGGNIQKLIVGREFSQDAKLLILEDPTRGIDIGAIEFIWKKIQDIAKAGAAVLLVSHELNEVMELSDRIMVMYDGRLYDGGLKGEKNEEQIGLLMMGGGETNEAN